MQNSSNNIFLSDGKLLTQEAKPYKNFDLEDYFDVIIITYYDIGNKTLNFNCYLNSFTYLVDEKDNKNFSNK